MLLKTVNIVLSKTDYLPSELRTMIFEAYKHAYYKPYVGAFENAFRKFFPYYNKVIWLVEQYTETAEFRSVRIQSAKLFALHLSFMAARDVMNVVKGIRNARMLEEARNPCVCTYTPVEITFEPGNGSHELVLYDVYGYNDGGDLEGSIFSPPREIRDF